MLDIIIKNGCVVDGTGNPWFKADIGIKDGKITVVGILTAETSEKTIEAEGLMVCPGFIDMHSHSDFSLLINPNAESKIRQGITTEVIGNCGGSAAPLDEAAKEEIRKTTPSIEEAKLELNWSTMGEYMSRLEREGAALNVAPLVGNANIRMLVIGQENRLPSKDELEKMKKALAQTMKDGAFGLSSGLIYAPSCYSDTNELVELCKVVAKFGGIYTSHIRGEGDRLLDSVKEAIEIGERANVPVEISHHKAVGEANWGKVKQTLKMIEDARNKGLDVTCDVYPYTAGSFGLDAMLPPYAHEGGVDMLIKRLKNLEARKKIKTDMKKDDESWASQLKDAGWDATVIADCSGHPEYEGKKISEIAETEGKDVFDFVFDLLIEEMASVSVIRFLMREEDVRTVLKHPASAVGTDASVRAPYGVLCKGKPHPRSYGTFPRVLGKYVREGGLLTFEEAIRKMTILPAQKLKLKDRGLVREGLWADVVILDPKRVADRATYAEPHQYSEGIECVLVNGKVVIEHGKHAGTLSGQVLRLS
ncbi:MAG: D-aminoacylase [Candidatus Bathyarchaeota archaeon]|nr:D-aminoacylase [Candidatus Bathyarchaeota archaeon]MDH5788735.1 D-aminoacylase [Candidatus Bathyarchaeota archaeon]